MAHFARGACWTSDDDMIDNGYRRVIKPVIAPVIEKKFTGEFRRRDKTANAKKGYNVMCDMMMGLWHDGLDYMKTVDYACKWLGKFNELNGIEECV